MLGRHARIHVRQRRILYLSHNLRSHPSLVPISALHPVSRRQFSLSTITEPLNEVVGSLPNTIQHTVPEFILHWSEVLVPASLPTYTTGILVFAALTRLCFFTPWAYWARRRKWRIREEIEPQVIAEFLHGWGPALKRKYTIQHVPSHETRKIINENIAFRRNELIKQHKLTMAPTIVIPAVFTIPIFLITTSMMYSAAALPEIAANPILNEMFISLPGEDISPTLPIAIGVISMLSLEVGTWSPKNIQASRQMNEREAQLAEQKDAADQESDALEIKPNAIALGFFRLLALARTGICIALPGTVNIYWFTSSLFGLMEASLFTFVENMRAPRLWGRHSPIVRLPTTSLINRGYDLSTKTPMERAEIPHSLHPHMPRQPQMRGTPFEKGATSVFLTGLQSGEVLKNSAHYLNQNVIPSTTNVARKTPYVLKNLGPYWRLYKAWLLQIGRDSRSRLSRRFRHLRQMTIPDYLRWAQGSTSKGQRGIERSWSWLARRLSRRLNSVEAAEKKGKADPGAPPPKTARQKAEIERQRKEKNKIVSIMMLKAGKRKPPSTVANQGGAQRAEVASFVIPGLQPPRKRPRKAGGVKQRMRPSLYA